MTKKIPLHRFLGHKEDSIPIELFSLDALPAVALLDKPNRHTFHELFWVTQGAGQHFIDFVGYDIRPNTLFFVEQGRVHFWDLAKPLQGYVALIKTDFLFSTASVDSVSRFELFRTIGRHPAIYPSPQEVPWFHAGWERIDHEFNSARFGRVAAINSLLQLIFIEAKRLIMTETKDAHPTTASERLTYRYQQLVEKKASEQHKVEAYADELGVATAYLSQCVKEVMGMTAGEILRRQIVLEAKRLLAYTDGTVAEIARQLNFKNASYFGRFFKRETSQTPGDFQTQMTFYEAIPD